MIVLWLSLVLTPHGQNVPARCTPPPSVMLIPVDPNAATFKLTSPDTGVPFDINGDGDLEQVAWTEAGAALALLALDVNGDGRITSGRELFGSCMLPGAGNGPNALIEVFKASGAPLSGSVHAGHGLYEQLLLWVDRNHNGVSDPGEVRRAMEAFTAIGMGFTTDGRRFDEHGNRFRFQGWAELRTGGPDQGRAASPAEQQPRLRHYFEVVLTTRKRVLERPVRVPINR